MVIAPWFVPLDQSLSSLFVPSHLPQPLPHPTPLAQPLTLPFHPATSNPSKQPSVATSTVGPAAAPTATSSISATNQTAVETTLALSALKYPNCNSTPPILTPPSTPVNIANLSTELEHHPDQQFVTSLLHDLQWGCHVGYTGPRFARRTPNLTSALLHPDAFSAAVAKEVSNGHTAGPFQTPPIPNLQCSPLGVVPKKDGTWRIIMDLSSPHGSSINDYISKEEFSLHYATFDQALSLVARYRKDALMAKLDIKHAFRLCPVHLEDRELLGIHWQGQYYIDLRLPLWYAIFSLSLQPFGRRL